MELATVVGKILLFGTMMPALLERRATTSCVQRNQEGQVLENDSRTPKSSGVSTNVGRFLRLKDFINAGRATTVQESSFVNNCKSKKKKAERTALSIHESASARAN